METEDLIHIKITKLINAPSWRAIRMLTKVWQFPKFVSTIKEVEVIERARNVVKTRWAILIDELTIKWVEEDTLDLQQNCIHFKAVEGDLKEFRGFWQFKKHAEGTEVSVDIYLNVGIPAVGQFANDYIRTIVEKNFNAILDSVEERLISNRYEEFKSGDKSKVAGFAILGHCYNHQHVVKYLKTIDPSFKVPSLEFLGKLF
ncbi:MAG: ribosome-associated toxin RatA of RatAB toxin-antitoxin module, partial [Lysobacterales bacterium]